MYLTNSIKLNRIKEDEIIKISDEKINVLKNILMNCKNEHMKIHLLENILELKINRIKLHSIASVSNFIDYDFSVLKFKIYIDDEKNKQSKMLYIKFIKKNKVKESIFCYWNLIYQELKNNYKEEMEGLKSKISISELKRKQPYKKGVLLNIEENNANILINGTKVYLVEIKEYIENYLEEDDIEYWNESIDNIGEYMLFVGIL